MRKQEVIVLSVAFICVVAVTAFIALYASRPPVPDAKLRQVKPGMSSEAVRALLGPPTSIFSFTNMPELGVPGTNNWAAEWTYVRNLPWGSAWVNVMFTNDAVSYTARDRFP